MKASKAGAVIFCAEPKPLILLLKSSNPMFGGSAWQLPKGGIDPGETPANAGFREAKEEAGLLESDVKNISNLGDFPMTGMTDTYVIHFISVETLKPKLSGQYHYETGATKWFTVEDALKVIKKNQKPVLLKAIQTHALIGKNKTKSK